MDHLTNRHTHTAKYSDTQGKDTFGVKGGRKRIKGYNYGLQLKLTGVKLKSSKRGRRRRRNFGGINSW